ncbi:hypothetical protein G7Y89_g4804 [Cudoniella acicularis]|uniref:Lysine-specific metallo-endopeptidase domain-containing protein n=1 Tax=Cudoniella acicularis TaxID=354080 RepID=A0A8H4W4L3_9HELO|nr:hypothetical protein G7Y89_g4804 [Cudoniella acicularis]
MKTSGLGSCDATQTPIIDSWLADTILLVDSALLGINSYQTDTSIQRNLGAFFGISSTRAGTKKLTTVQSNDWQVETEIFYDDEGNPIPDKEDNTKPASLRTYPPSTGNSVTDEMLEDMQEGTSPNWAKFAYYSSDLKDYVIEEAANRYPGNPPSWCNGASATPPENRFALTESRLTRDVVTLCLDAFAAVSEPYETIAAAMASTSSKTPGDSLNDASPRSLTLFHELIHMTTTPDKTPDTATKPTECLDLTVNGADATQNPDSYVFMAWSYYLTKNGQPPFEWQEGLAQNIKP